jgi:hypothetical protein
MQIMKSLGSIVKYSILSLLNVVINTILFRMFCSYVLFNEMYLMSYLLKIRFLLETPWLLLVPL